VVAGEGVELGLQGGDVAGGGLAGEPFLQRLVEPLDLAAGLRVVGPGMPEADVQCGQLDLQGDHAAAAGLPVNTAPLSDSIEAGSPQAAAAARNTVTTSAALNVGRAADAVSSRE
jgi:hypothetical protein